jgi:hypothetical protein
MIQKVKYEVEYSNFPGDDSCSVVRVTEFDGLIDREYVCLRVTDSELAEIYADLLNRIEEIKNERT